MDEPIIHSHISDMLPENHPLAYEEVECYKCNDMVHCFNNECMRPWVEWLGFNLCFECFLECCYTRGLITIPGFMVKIN
jgi:hypothetical protein